VWPKLSDEDRGRVLLAERHADGLTGPAEVADFPETLAWPEAAGWGCAAARAAQLREARRGAESAAPFARQAAVAVGIRLAGAA
jgi:hypothetical protein